jgi:hypothetical protein
LRKDRQGRACGATRGQGREEKRALNFHADFEGKSCAAPHASPSIFVAQIAFAARVPAQGGIFVSIVF